MKRAEDERFAWYFSDSWFSCVGNFGLVYQMLQLIRVKLIVYLQLTLKNYVQINIFC